MSGHSRWAQIKHQKAETDAKRGNLFSRLARAITLAAREGGDPETNTKLRLAVERAREFNMPSDNIDRAMRKATSTKEAETLSEVTYEAYGPGGSAFLIEAITDSKNRTAQELKHTLAELGGKMADPGAVSWMFERKGVITLIKSENPSLGETDAELRLIEAGADDIDSDEKSVTILTARDRRELVAKNLAEQGLVIKNAGEIMIPTRRYPLSKPDEDAAQKLYAALEAGDDVQNVWSTLEP